LSIGTGGPQEEFPLFRTFWLEKPKREADAVVVHALLDSQSVTGAYRMRIAPGETTVMDIQAKLFPRTTIQTPGLGAMSSMFFLGPAGMRRFDDFRGAVHDSDGLEMWTGSGQRLWRPLSNPRSVQISAFQDENPKGFGLMQRMRALDAYNDLEARYDRRPSLWVEPVGKWGAGSVQLLEIPTDDETADNIAAFWRPKAEWRAGRPVELAYRLHWGNDSPVPQPEARVASTRVGETRIGPQVDGRRHFAVDYEGLDLVKGLERLSVQVSASLGRLSPARLDPYPSAKEGVERVRVSFDFAPPSGGAAELRLELRRDDRPFGETWLNRYSA
jgi:glucans biosynthesis protein